MVTADTGDALLIDFAAAVEQGEQGQYFGALSHASISVLEALAQSNSHIVFTVADELESLVHTVFTFISPHQIANMILDTDERTKAATLIRFWNEAMSPRHWQEAICAARAAQYDTLTEVLGAFLANH